MVSQPQVGYSRDKKGFPSYCQVIRCENGLVFMGLEIVAQVIGLPTMYEALGSIPRCGGMLLQSQHREVGVGEPEVQVHPQLRNEL